MSTAAESALQPARPTPEDSANGMTDDRMTPPAPPPSLEQLSSPEVLEPPLAKELRVAATTNGNGYTSAPLPHAEPEALIPAVNGSSNGAASRAALAAIKAPAVSSSTQQAAGAARAGGATAGGSSRLGCLYWVTKIQPTNYDMVSNSCCEPAAM